MSHFKRILVPVDGSATSNKALTQALNLARDGGGRVRLVHVVDALAYLTGFEASSEVLQAVLRNGRKVLDDASTLAAAAGVVADVVLLDEPALRLGDSVAEAARKWEADLVVVGTHGRKGVSRVLLGSGAEQVIRCARMPVLVVHGDDSED